MNVVTLPYLFQSSYWQPHSLYDYLRDVSTRLLGDARQVFVLSEAEETRLGTQTFLAGLQVPRFVRTSLGLNVTECELLVDTFFIFLGDTADRNPAEFLARLPRCWIRARFVVVFPERWILSENEHKRKCRDFCCTPTLCYTGWRRSHLAVSGLK